ncbi:hypothetical protein [Streptomyces sp. NPDC002187]|uniref:hypothetical protein n=1 Tax=Streptomyces sp. NPDC002187 TaxID=3364637 RepID=UPI003683D170
MLGTGWFGAFAARAGPGKTVAIVGDGAVGLLVVPATERIIAMSRHEPRQKLARDSAPPTSSPSSATGYRQDQGTHRRPRRPLRDRVRRHPEVDAPGHRLHPPADTSAASASPSTAMSCSSPTSTCTAAPPQLIDLIRNRQINTGKVLDLGMASEAQQAMVELRAIKAILRCSPP